MRPSRIADLPSFTALDEYFDLFSGVTADTPERLMESSTPSGLQKTYLLETVGDVDGAGGFSGIFGRSSMQVERLRGSTEGYSLFNSSGVRCAVVEVLTPRYLAAYTLLPSQGADKFFGRMVAENPLLDHLWLSSHAFRAIWAKVRAQNSGRRYGKITFEHESIFQVDLDAPPGSENWLEEERRASRFTMVDRLDVIERQMGPLGETYAPLASITHLRIPSVGKGGHDLYLDGKVTNRSGSFLDHRAAIGEVVDMYAKLTSRIEEELWVGRANESGEPGLSGSVAELSFRQPLSQETFSRWMLGLWNNRRNRFRLSGFPTWQSETCVQVNAIDQHLWQPLVMEFTTKRVLMIIPDGTCGNTLNRLVSNVQRFVDPQVDVMIGGRDYASLIPSFSGGRVA